MDLKSYRAKLIGNEDERAVSPVIGVILMVAITVILAAVIAAFVLDIGDLDDSAPNAQFDWETDDDDDETYILTHTSGDDIDPENIEFQNRDDGDEPDDWGNGDITAGDEANIEVSENGDTVAVVWEADGSSTVLTEYDG